MVHVRRSWLTELLPLAFAAGLVAGCHESQPLAQGTAPSPAASSSGSIPAGTHIDVVLGSTLSSELARAGDSWHGRVARDVLLPGGGHIAAGSGVSGSVAEATGARRGGRARLELGMTDVRIGGVDQSVDASSEAITAGSTRKRNLGAIAGGVVAGALMGRVVGDGHNAAAGGLVGGAVATGAVAESKGFQVVMAGGSVLRFTVRQGVVVH